MLSKCANPGCSTRFRYLRDGRLYQIEVQETPPPTGLHLVDKPAPRKVEHFWLCAECSTRMTLAYQRGKGVVTLPVVRAAVAS